MNVAGRLASAWPWLAAAAAGAVLLPSAAPAQVARYDAEYPSIAYSRAPTDNPVSRLAERLESGEVRLEYRDGRGYLDSLLEALEIDPSSQTLVYSKTSLQFHRIDSETPRAIYFNDDTYVGWVQNSDIVELATIDPGIGPVFYIFNNRTNADDPIERENERCLNCHDTQGMMGGGVPLLMVRSSFVDVDGVNLQDLPGLDVTDETPLQDRWGGWYVTGRSNGQAHRGNLLLQDETALAALAAVRRDDIDTLEGLGFFDAEPYLTAHSDIVALMVLEHQIGVQNRIAYVKFKAPFVLERTGHPGLIDAASWDELPPNAQGAVTRMLDALVERLLLVGAIDFAAPLEGTAGFETWFEAQGPRDAEGRSLRDLDLQTRLFEHPLSYVIYSDAFDGLPGFAKDYVYRRIAAVLDGSDRSEAFAGLSADERSALREILTATKPEFAPYAAGG